MIAEGRHTIRDFSVSFLLILFHARVLKIRVLVSFSRSGLWWPVRSGTDRTGRRSADQGPPREEKTSRRHPEAGSAPRAPPPPARHTSYPHICEPAKMAPEGAHAKERRARERQIGAWTANGRQAGSRAPERLAGDRRQATPGQLTAGRILRLLITSGIFFAAKAPWRSEKNYLCGRRFGQKTSRRGNN